jgi:hypothetical protein
MGTTEAGTRINGTTGGQRPACPRWCVGHHVEHGSQTHRSAPTRIAAAPGQDTSWITAQALTDDSDLWRHGQVVSIIANPPGGEPWSHAFLAPASAEAIADIIGFLATATPEQHRELATGIRRCATLIAAGGTSRGRA